MNYTNTFFNNVLHLLYPRICAGCGSDLIQAKQIICLDCINELPLTNFFMYADNPVERIFRGRLPLTAGCAFLYFTKQSVVQNLLHQFKYKGNQDIGSYFGRMMGQSLMSSPRYEDVNAIIPLPLFYKKEKKRGYNQSAVISEALAEVMKIPVLKEIIVRNRNTETQTHMSRMERWNNIEEKFELRKGELITDKHILLVDDVLTTGATIEACGSEILKANGVRLSIACLAYTSL